MRRGYLLKTTRKYLIDAQFDDDADQVSGT